jgi:hypothetical protein
VANSKLLLKYELFVAEYDSFDSSSVLSIEKDEFSELKLASLVRTPDAESICPEDVLVSAKLLLLLLL